MLPRDDSESQPAVARFGAKRGDRDTEARGRLGKGEQDGE
jgi:hypothetical protein